MLLGDFEKLKKATISYVKCICPSVSPSVSPSVPLSAWNNLAPTGQMFLKFDI